MSAPHPKPSAEELRARFYYHAPSEDGAQLHARLSQGFDLLAGLLVSICPAGRELSLALTKLEEGKFWASAAVARNPETR